MIVRIISLLLATTLASCGQADLDGISKRFAEQSESFVKMYSMIQEDTKGTNCFAVGTDHIGEYWGHDNKWSSSKNYQRKITLDQVLKEVGLSEKRYHEYLSLFQVTKSERIEYCPKKPSWARIMVHRSGLAVSGCLTTVNLNGDGSVPATEKEPGYSSEIRLLGDGWYLNHDCT
ncbi:hypothetical protein ACOBV9_08760 [Pseudoalteromonas espejiana]